MAFGELNIAKLIAENSPKYGTIIEPFGDGGAFALYLKKKKPKQHILNYEDEELFKIMLIIQNMSGSDFKNLKSRDWIGNLDTFNKAVSISAVDGLDLFYRYFYLKHFSERQLDKEATPIFDVLKNSVDIKLFLFDFKLTKVGLKGVTLINQESISVMSMSGQNPFYILTPKTPEQQTSVESKLDGLNNFFYAKKKKDNETLILDLKAEQNNFISVFAQSTIMMADMQIETNYESRLVPLEIETLEMV